MKRNQTGASNSCSESLGCSRWPQGLSTGHQGVPVGLRPLPTPTLRVTQGQASGWGSQGRLPSGAAASQAELLSCTRARHVALPTEAPRDRLPPSDGTKAEPGTHRGQPHHLVQQLLLGQPGPTPGLRAPLCKERGASGEGSGRSCTLEAERGWGVRAGALGLEP